MNLLEKAEARRARIKQQAQRPSKAMKRRGDLPAQVPTKKVGPFHVVRNDRGINKRIPTKGKQNENGKERD